MSQEEIYERTIYFFIPIRSSVFTILMTVIVVVVARMRLGVRLLSLERNFASTKNEGAINNS